MFSWVKRVSVALANGTRDLVANLLSMPQLDVHRTHTPRCEVKKIIALWRMYAVMQSWKEVGCED